MEPGAPSTLPNRPPHGEVSLLWRALNLAKPQLPPYPQPLPMGNKLSLYGSCQGDTRNRTCSLRAIDYSANPKLFRI
ncbi:MAG: hypothetical protein EAZ39_11650 [Oscillatoriales cyanobacterium]|nr:MAG: hypothetical protein EAZ39_11650 [Oscillatoriales cyanobacterium]